MAVFSGTRVEVRTQLGGNVKIWKITSVRFRALCASIFVRTEPQT